jgi:NTP pyrophosphatase (non-canonical NTP hydrolase)
MSYLTNGLSFNTLRQANIKRLPTFKNKKGELAHSKPDGSDWTPAQWLQAVAGEVGEYANLRKKFERGDIDEAEFLAEAKKELADIVTYLDILAFQLKIDLGNAVKEKFNEISKKVGSNIIIGDDDDWHYDDIKVEYSEPYEPPFLPIRNQFCFIEDDLRTAINLAREFNMSDMGVIEYTNSDDKIVNQLKNQIP